jgi:hypothetical protein
MRKPFPDPDPADGRRGVTGNDYQRVLIRLFRPRDRCVAAIEEDATPAWMCHNEHDSSAFGTLAAGGAAGRARPLTHRYHSATEMASPVRLIGRGFFLC